MFYCNECRKEKSYPQQIHLETTKCDFCGQVRSCFVATRESLRFMMIKRKLEKRGKRLYNKTTTDTKPDYERR